MLSILTGNEMREVGWDNAFCEGCDEEGARRGCLTVRGAASSSKGRGWREGAGVKTGQRTVPKELGSVGLRRGCATFS